MVSETQLNAQNILNNLKNWDFEYLGQYKLDEKEANKLIPILEYYILSKSCCKEVSSNAD